MTGRTQATSDRSTERESSTSGLRDRLGRRTYLQAIGAYAAGRTLLGLAGRTTAAEYRTYEVGSGETFQRRVESGETLENLLVDASAAGAGVDITAEGSDWTIRNVGIRGTYTGEAAGSVFTLQVAEGATGTIENVYLGDGATDGGYGGVFVPTGHAGTLTIRRCHVAEWPDNGVYASAPGREERDGRKGVVEIEQSYAYNNNVAGFRLGTDGSRVRESVVHVDGDVPNNGAGKENARGIWVKEGGVVDIEACDVLLGRPDGTACIREDDNNSRGLARVIDSSVAARADAERFSGNVVRKDVDDDPDVSLPAGVPESARAAARGANESEGADDTDRIDDTDDGGEKTDTGEGSTRTDGSVLFAGGDSAAGEYLEYAVATSGKLAGRASIEDGEGAAGGRATGKTGGARDAFAFDGEVESLEATLRDDRNRRRARVVVDGGDASTIRFEGGTDGELLEYELTVTGSLGATASVEERSDVSANSAEGATGGAADAFVFTGEIASLRAAFPPDAGEFLVELNAGFEPGTRSGA